MRLRPAGEGQLNPFIRAITSADPCERDRPFHEIASAMPPAGLQRACEELDQFRLDSGSLYDRVRASCFLYAAYRYLLPDAEGIRSTGEIPFSGFEHLLARRFEEALSEFREALERQGPSATVFSAMAAAYHQLAFQILADQVRRSVRATRGNQWMFRVAHPDDHTIRVRRELLRRPPGVPLFPVLSERTPVRLDLSHSGWSDIFFLGMDYPEGARVLNISVDLGVHGRDEGVSSPIEACFRVIPEPVIRLCSVDLKATKDVTDLRDLFNFGNDYLSLLKAGVIASGVIPPSFEGGEHALADILARIAGPGLGFELVTNVNEIPKGSRLAVSTNLLAGIIALLMRATGQADALEGGLTEQERRLTASRAILGEWLGGSGGGWQDSGGIWPALKLIEGTLAEEGDPEFGVSRGRLLPRHRLLDESDLHPDIRARLADSLVLIHGGLAQNVGPVLEMVTERYLLRQQPAWNARLEMRGIFDSIVESLRTGDVQTLARCTTANWEGPLKTIIPWVTNAFTETIIARAREKLGEDFWGFLMLGGMSGGGMAMLVDPKRSAAFRTEILEIMRGAKGELDQALPFAMDPLVYNFEINNEGTTARLLTGAEALMPARYYGVYLPQLAREKPDSLTSVRRAELNHFTSSCSSNADESFGLLQTVVSGIFRGDGASLVGDRSRWQQEMQRIREENGFDAVQHEQIRADLKSGRIGLARNRLPMESEISDVAPGDVTHIEACAAHRARGEAALAEGRVAVMSLAGGVGTRWTHGAGVVKAINPFIEMAGRHRSFLEIHLARTRRASRVAGAAVPHIVTTSYLTHDAIAACLGRERCFGWDGPLYLSPGQSIAQRLVPMVRDLVFLWEETPQAALDEQKQKVRDAVRAAMMDWARGRGEGSEYQDNLPAQCFNPPGHWYEAPNLLRNGTLARLLDEHPQVETLLLHNIDTLGVTLDPAILGWHLESGNMLTYEVVPRRVEDRGGGLARVNGRIRLLEGLAQPRDDVELRLSYYNSATCWISIDPLLKLFGLTRADLKGPRERIAEAVRDVARRLPTYVTIKDVKYRWGHGQEDVYPVTQFEKLWGDMTALPDVTCGYLVVPRLRGQQLKDPDELDAWAQDGSRDYVARQCDFVPAS